MGAAGLLWTVMGIDDICGGDWFGSISRFVFLAEAAVIVFAEIRCFFTEKGAIFPLSLKPKEFTARISENGICFYYAASKQSAKPFCRLKDTEDNRGLFSHYIQQS